MRLGSHRLTGLNIGQYSQGEVSLAEPLYALIPDLSVLIVDRGFLCWPRFWHHQQAGQQRHWLIRAKSNLRWTVIKEFGPGDQLVEIKFTREARKADPSLQATMQARVIAYQIPGFQPERLVTSLTDAISFPVVEVVGLYHERWEFELGLDEIKTHTLERVETVRSTTPDRVRQEVWGLAITYNVVRQEMARIAGVLGVPALRLSYRWCLLLFRNLWSSAWVVASGLIPKHLEQLVVDVENLLLPERRRERRNPRAVKVKMSGYAKKRRAGAA
jgi:Transposase DDE domain